ncbi:dTDP-4-dehydrorhamnose 3,5-epimerase [Cytobacillus firmus]|jgi:dTDP-4-dehydrorhamnose 3,5-epimerase|uniref:dTDP-4-dehydrorhamnose 3,5-epimerase n=1 Tax=Cytobacillus firmus TaxID=1399 RepID=A0AA46PRZ9_CYTFI|nr:dTDP-4-dehydrorhamnose 3,5-epimerase [Cytobacillus firmus]KML36103.1 dTDP-4-dehydrorhamnose 3,5-epimerase [Cytobacillus firmus]MCS0652944.1 dTDP-4-dehydrorhamnose 3,5-epimerase [Cytobacillus firmus]MCU1803816.1 dTDP-4-dehydrorhamnose 3,5-epimerase [Cytobacillus firmus]UYG95802.1 dTDP-4-dehydrorhamnose 3,5-epimerase [Cytobacillus firmus]WHY36519.1 dTDP-4-dehydrorhamnose 3,5-epimerase [Cytobacillus firmus]
MLIKSTSIPGCYEILPNIFKDKRGAFVKTYSTDLLELKSLNLNFVEQYYSVSNQGVLRGMHFQVPPKNHAKLICLISGHLIDAVVDLRIGSPAYGKYQLFELKAESGNMLYIPSGLAHGFYVLSTNATLLYNATQTYSPSHDYGIHWDSIGIPWPVKNPIVSERDSGFAPFSNFSSPFKYNGVNK